VPPDAAAIDAALLTTLAGDAELAGLLPDGVWYGDAPADRRRFVLVSLFSGRDEGVFGGRAFVDAVYLVKAVVFEKHPEIAVAAAARIDALLEDVPLVVAGWTCMAVYREQRIGHPEPDDLDPGIRWQHYGGQYRLQFSVTGA
jgi:hypothetical protein